MLKGKELGAAIASAIEKKLAIGAVSSKAEIARHFKVKPPSIHDWIKKGSIEKDKLPELWRYFADVVDLEHWGLKSWPHISAQQPQPATASQQTEASSWPAYSMASETTKAAIDLLLLAPNLRVYLAPEIQVAINTLESLADKKQPITLSDIPN